MRFQPENTYHIFNQGNNQATIFHDDEDYTTFLNLIRQLFLPNCEILAWCLTPDHFHFLIYTNEKSCMQIQQGGITINQLTNCIRKLLSGYARIYNAKYIRTGSLFRQKTKSKIVSEVDALAKKCSLADYIYTCFSYVHLNPVEAKIVADPSEWIYSSFPDYAGKRNGNLCNKQLAAKLCGFSKIDFK